MTGKKIYLDSSIFIYHFENSSTFSKYTQKLFEMAEQGKLKLGTSALVFSEITPPIYKEKNKEILAIYSNMDKPPVSIEIIDLNKEIALLAGKIRGEYNFSTPDSIHLASACYAEYDIFVTNDSKLYKFKGICVCPLTKVFDI